ncbi:MAG: hypothetical protein A3G76_00935 [Acidobacteria bacterium RIFCSPLOWO2_12_FULL_65_11]|nr:MAG: hypothetical protein A3G76_00935 [Acidobacteria bacterium RIFCSPLOWO2_12_FULL_65_11]
MSRRASGGTFAAGQLKRAAALLSLGLVLLFAQPGGHAQTGDGNALTFFKNYFVTGDYVVGGVGLRGLGVNGIATGTITIGGVPADANILAAFLYWQEVSKDSLGPDSGAVGATFNGNALFAADGPLAKVLDPAGTAPCWSSGGGTGSSGGQHKTYTYRADVLGLFDVDQDGKLRVNGAHQIQLPDSGSSGNGVPIALGASLVVVYRDAAAPLRAVVLYDGGYTMDQTNETMSQAIRGFYQAAEAPNAKLTHIVGSGQANKSERLLLPGLAPILNPFTGSLGASWDSSTFNVGVPAGTDSTTTSVDHVGFSSFDCLSWGAIVFSTSVQDTDGDGLLDVWETSTDTIDDPNGQPLPNLHAMGADPLHKDLFVEVGYMSAGEGTYGGVLKPAHTHLPAPAALKMAGDAFKNAPVSNPDAYPGISVHFDVGNNYQPGQSDHEAEGSALDPYIIPASLARGGEAITEAACVADTQSPPRWGCQFPAYPGTISWKTGFQLYRDAPVSSLDGGPITPEELAACRAAGDCRRRFDRNRKDMFRYVLGAHFLGLPKAPCLNEDGSADADCRQNNPDFHVPRTISGVGDFPGGDLMLTLGGFADSAGKPVGTPFMQAATLMHELGHTFELTHAGAPQVPREPNCKPNYLSTMNYLFQLRGLFNDLNPGVPHVDFSAQVLGDLDERFLADGPLSGTPRYRTGWYAPQRPDMIGSAARRYCNGSALPNPLPDGWVPMVRVDGTSVTGAIDWNADGDPLDSAFSQDINFNGENTQLNAGSDDWANLGLNQLGSRRNVVLALGDDGYWDLGDDDGYWDLGDDGYWDLGDDDGYWDLGDDDGYWDVGDDDGYWDIGAAGEVDDVIAAASGNTPPTQVTACVIGIGTCTGGPFHRIRLDWKSPNVGTVLWYFAYRFRTDDPTETKTLVGQVSAAIGVDDYSLVDSEELPNASFTYVVVAEFNDATPTTSNTISGPSFPAIGPTGDPWVMAVNDPPVAVDDPPVAIGTSYIIDQGTTLNVETPGVLGNDTDVDSASLTAALVAPPLGGTLVLNANGSFTYTPVPGFVGSDSFTYTANDVDPGRSSNVATVSITVQDTTPPVVTLSLPTPDGLGGFFVTSPVIVGVSAVDASSVSAFACTDNGSPIGPGSLAGIGTPTASGSLSVSAEGTHNLICTATDSAGNSGAASGSSNTGTVKIDTQPPTVTIAAPASNAAYLLNASVASSFTCSDPTPGSGLATCVGPVSSGSNFDTSTVGPKTFAVTARDVAGNQTTTTNNYSVNYSMTLTPLKSPAQQGSAVPVVWQLKDGLGNIISSLNTLLKMESAFNGPVPPGGCVSSAIGTKETLYSLPNGATGGSTFRLVSGGYKFNWDTTTTTTLPVLTGKGCYTVLIYLNDESAAKMTTAVQLK